jgi:uncharacterized membrane protein
MNTFHLAEDMWDDQRKAGETNTYEERTSVDGLYTLWLLLMMLVMTTMVMVSVVLVLVAVKRCITKWQQYRQ